MEETRFFAGIAPGPALPYNGPERGALYPMKTTLLAVLLTLGLAICAAAAEPPPLTVEAVAAENQNLADELQEAQTKIKDLEARLAAVEQRLGDFFEPASPFNTIARRLEDIENDLKRR